METAYTYKDTLAAAEKANWRVEDIIGSSEKQLDFTKPFLPESLARTGVLTCLSEHERLRLNQVRGHEYLYIFGLVEEFILPFVMDQAAHQLHEENTRVRALLQFAGEEAKHIQLFKQFRKEFLEGFGSDCAVIGPPEGIAGAVLAHHPLSVALAILHIEWMTQTHYVESVKGDVSLCPQFKSLLRHHWMEESQHAKFDTLIIEALVAGLSEREIEGAIKGYLEIGMLLDCGLMQQVLFDIKALEASIGRDFSRQEKRKIQSVQEQAVRWTFLGSGMSHPRFLSTMEQILPGSKATIMQVAPAFS